MFWFNLVLIFALGATSGFFMVLTLVYRARMSKAQKSASRAVDGAALAQSSEMQWQRLASDRDRHLHELRDKVLTLHQELQVAQNSVEAQNIQLRDRDRRLAEQTHHHDMHMADMTSTWTERLHQASQKVIKMGDKVAAAEREVLSVRHRYDKDRDAWLARIDELMTMITTHRDKRGHECCHLNDGELYAAAGLEPADPRLPPLGEFIPQCIAYWFDKQGLPQPSANCRPRMPTCLPPEFDRDTVEEIIYLLGQPTLEVDERLRLAGFGFGVAGKDTSWCLMAVPACNFAAEVWHSDDSLDLASRFRAAIQRAADASPYLAEVHCDSQVH